MSHFVVVVIGEDVEGQLAPYQENGNGDLPEELLAFEDCTEEVEKDWEDLPLDTLAQVGEEKVREYKTIQEYAKEYHGYEDHEGKFGYWHNPNSHWDWWVVGGRWGGFFPVKEEAQEAYPPATRPAVRFRDPDEEMPGTANALYLKDLDIERAHNEAEKRAREEFGKWKEIFTKCGRAESWTDIRDKHEGDIDKARNVYGNQLAIAKYKEGGFSFECPVHCFGFDEETYVEKCRNQALVPYAIVKDGEWHAKGEMGWFGMSKDDTDQDTWNKEFHKLLTDLPPDTLLTAVDCHV